jgi:alanine-glyoxylate transaminase/serine-glyoxylate transaminase/serine-pyruvate transaminase
VQAWGLKICTQKPEWHSDTVTAVVVPPHIDSGNVVKIAWKKYNLNLGVGLNKIAGKVFRIGHLGYLNEVHINSTQVTTWLKWLHIPPMEGK